MAAERCPLCQSTLNNGECASCGYRIPDEGGISAYYNYAPSDYPREQPAVREITPEHQAEEIYPNRPEPIDLIKVRNDEGKTVNDSDNTPNYQNSGEYPCQPQQNSGSNLPDSVLLKVFLEKFWYLPLLAFIFPFPVGVIIFAVIAVLTKNDQASIRSKLRNLIMIPLILGFIFSYFSPLKIFW